MTRFIALLAAAAVAVDARAASFDCAKATRPQERVVCGDPELSKLDERMAEAYREARDTLSEGPRRELLRAQREWLRYWPRDCSSKRRVIVLEENGVDCARAAYAARIETLKVDPAFLGRFKVYGEAAYVARWTPERDEDFDIWTVVVGHAWVHPQIDVAGLRRDDAKLATALNAWLASGPVPGWVEFGDRLATSTRTTTVRGVSPRIVGATTQIYLYGVGAAHGAETVTHTHYNLRRMRPLRAADVFTGKAWVGVLAEQVEKELVRTLGDMLVGISSELHAPSELHAQVQETSRWILRPDGLGIQFGEYEVACYAMGTPVVVVPWARLAGHLTPFAKAELGVGK